MMVKRPTIPESGVSRLGGSLSPCRVLSSNVRVVDRIVKVVTKRRLGEPDTSWTDYWRTRPVSERLAMATELSLECVDGHPDQGLRRVHRVLRRS